MHLDLYPVPAVKGAQSLLVFFKEVICLLIDLCSWKVEWFALPLSPPIAEKQLWKQLELLAHYCSDLIASYGPFFIACSSHTRLCLHLLFPLPGTHFHQTPAWLTSSYPSILCSNGYLFNGPSLLKTATPNATDQPYPVSFLHSTSWALNTNIPCNLLMCMMPLYCLVLMSKL